MEEQAKYSSSYLSPTLVVGLGGTGVETARLIKENLRATGVDYQGVIEFLTIDTDVANNLPGQEPIYPNEFAYIGGYNSSIVLANLDRYPEIGEWWWTSTSSGQRARVAGDIYRGARQKRFVGRLSLYVKWAEVARKLERKIERINEIARKEAVQRLGATVDRTGRARVYIISSVCGGTGSGTFLDVAFKVRSQLAQYGDIVGILLMPSCFKFEMQAAIQKQRIHANAYAALMELNHWMIQGKCSMHFPNEEPKEIAQPFGRVLLIDKNNSQESLSDLAAIRQMVAQFVYLDLATSIGQAALSQGANVKDLGEEMLTAQEASTSQSLGFGSFATASLVLPVERHLRDKQKQFTRAFISESVLSNLSPMSRYEVIQKAEVRASRIAEELQCEEVVEEQTESAEESTEPLDPLFEFLAGGAAPSEGGARAAKLRNPTLLSERFKKSLLDIIEDAKRVLSDFGLEAQQVYLKELRAELADAAKKELGELKKVQSKLIALSPLNGQSEGRENTAWSGILKPLNLVVDAGYMVLGQPTPTEERRKANEAAAIARRAQQGALKEEEAFLTSLTVAYSRFDEQLDEICQQVERLNGKLKMVGEESLPFSPNGQVEESDEDLWELATFVGSYEDVRNGFCEKSYLDTLLEEMLVQRILPEEVKDDLRERFFAEAAPLRILPTNRPGDDVVADRLAIAEGKDFSVLLKEITHDLITQLRRVVPELRISHYFDWFYKNVYFVSGGKRISARYSPIDPLHILRQRVPLDLAFVDLARERLGSSQANIEPVRILGIDRELDDTDGIHNNIFRDFEGEYFTVATGNPHRLDVAVAIYGFALAALADRNEMRHQYEEFLKRGEVLHIHRDWHDGNMGHW